MSNAVMPYMAKALSSKTLKNLKRQVAKTQRKITAKTPTLEIFLRIDDPYSYLLIQILPNFIQRFNVKISFHTVLEMDSDMFPALDMWREYARKDAGYLAALYNITPPVANNHILSRDILESATTELLLAESGNEFLVHANRIFSKVWQNNQTPKNGLNEVNLKAQLATNQQLLKSRGHYFGAMIHFEYEWYWGLDRLDHLEQRLIDEGFAKNINEKIQFNLTYKDFCQHPFPALEQQQKSLKPLTIFWSARSPYSYLGLERAVKLTQFYQIPLIVKPILPMMMRGMNVPKTKKMYIFFDTKREAEKHSLPYGFVADPLGAAVERCYALIDYASQESKLIEFLLSFSRGVNSEGIRAETDKGLQQIIERCSLDWPTAKSHLNNLHWQKQVDDNLNEMLTLGCWGVPSFHYDEKSYWGQDRLGIIEQEIRKNRLAT